MRDTMLLRHSVAAIFGAIALTSVTSAQNSSYGYYGNQPPGSCYDLTGIPIYTKFSLPDGFPDVTPGSTKDKDISDRAGGIQSNMKPQNSVSTDTVISIRLTAQYSYYIIALFTQLVKYITEDRPGFVLKNSEEREYALLQLQSQIAQSEKLTITIVAFLRAYGLPPEPPCQYQLPFYLTDDYYSYLYAGASVLEIFLAVFQTFIQRLAQVGDKGYIPTVVSIYENLSERAGVLRRLLVSNPSGNPFPASISREAAYSYLNQRLIVPGSCPGGATIDLKLYGTLVYDQEPLQCGDVDQVIQYRAKVSDLKSTSGLYLVYNNQQNQVVVVPIQDPQVQDGCFIFSAVYPCSLLTFGRGFTSIAVVDRPGPFYTVEDVTSAEVLGITFTYRD